MLPWWVRGLGGWAGQGSAGPGSVRAPLPLRWAVSYHLGHSWLLGGLWVCGEAVCRLWVTEESGSSAGVRADGWVSGQDLSTAAQLLLQPEPFTAPQGAPPPPHPSPSPRPAFPIHCWGLCPPPPGQRVWWSPPLLILPLLLDSALFPPSPPGFSLKCRSGASPSALVLLLPRVGMTAPAPPPRSSPICICPRPQCHTPWGPYPSGTHAESVPCWVVSALLASRLTAGGVTIGLLESRLLRLCPRDLAQNRRLRRSL